jgi:hypothetical protein
MTEPDNLVLAMLREMRADMNDMRAEMATKGDIADLRSEMKSGFTAVASDLLTTEKRLSEQIVGLRRAVSHGDLPMRHCQSARAALALPNTLNRGI